jgi:membrane-bound lytic murein transglycosylase MltF
MTSPTNHAARWLRRTSTKLFIGSALLAVVAGAHHPAAAQESEELPLLVQAALEPWTGTFDRMVERSMIRVAIPVSLATYFMDGKLQKGPTYDQTQEFEKYLRKQLGKPARNLTVVVVPSRRDRVLDMVLDGRADIAAGIVTVTEERAQRLDFAPPLMSGISEIIVTGGGVAAASSFDDFVGVPIHIRRSTSFWATLEAINKERVAKGAKPLTIVAADELLRTEDLLEMVGAGAIPATVADSPVAGLFARHFKGLTLHSATPLATGRSYAWAYRKGDPAMAEALAGFVKTAAKGTFLGNVILAKYTRNTDWIANVTDPGEQKKLRAVVDLFRTYATRYDFDWLMVAAQGYQESTLDHSRQSHVGAVGIMQVLPTTAKDPAVGIPDVHELESNVHAGIKYLNLMRTEYYDGPEIDELNRMFFSFAAYNAGPGNVNKARRRAEKLGLDRNIWFENVEIAMAQAVSREPVVYVRNILKYYTAFNLLLAERESRKTLQ